MKKIIIAAVLVLTTVITALSFNKKDDTAKGSTIKMEKATVSDIDHSVPKRDISTID